MENQTALLEGMIALQENKLEMLYEAVVTSKWNTIDKRACMEKIRAVDAKYSNLSPIKSASQLTDAEKVKVGRKFGLRKVGSVMLAALGGAGIGAGAAVVGGAAKGAKDVLSQSGDGRAMKNIVKNNGVKVAAGYAKSRNVAGQAKEGAQIGGLVGGDKAGVGAGIGAAGAGAVAAIKQRNKYVETNCNGRLCYVGESGKGVKVTLVYHDNTKKLVMKSFTI